MKKGLLLVAALGAVLMTGCGWFTCNKETKTTEKVSTKETKEVKAAEKPAN
ncbi:MAG: hypothetical protein QG604_45 [Candidatus Dependentiae bacterium]|nr:hypothetical protein [Candidatus Dependentiae bacterium]